MQEMEGKFFPISFASKKLNKTEQNYSATEKECGLFRNLEVTPRHIICIIPYNIWINPNLLTPN